MIHSVKFTCVIDTNEMYPLYTRDLLLWFAHYDLYTPKWSENIFSEWKEVMIRKGISEEEAVKRIDNVQKAFPDALVENYCTLIPSLELPDEKDRHVLAAAIKTNANLIVTENIKDFPEKYLLSFGLSAKRADDFCTDLIDLNPEMAKEAFLTMVRFKKNPPLTEFELLDILRKQNLKNTADYLHALI